MTVAVATVLNFGSNKITKVADGVAVDDAATVGQVATATSGASTALGTEITNRTNADTAIQNELDATQTGAGLSTAGAYVANTSANYISAVATLNAADVALDAALKTEVDNRTTAVGTVTTNLGTEVTNRTNADTAIQNELDATQTGAGLSTAGAYVANTSANYIASASSLNNADVVLDTNLKSISNELNASQAGAGLGTDGTYTANSGSNYISAATTLVDADNKLDAQLKSATDTLTTNLGTEVTNRTNADTLIRSDINAQNFTYESSVAALTHTITHNLNTAFVNYTVWIKGGDNAYRNDIVAVTETSANVLTIDLTESRNVKIAVRKVANI